VDAWETLLDYYQRELAYLRKMGVEFARSYPKVARRLEIGPDESDDPQVERLIESFAFLTGRLQRNIDAEFPRFTEALLGLLHPQLVAPVPAMAVARFDVDPAQGKLNSGFLIDRHTPLFAQTDAGVICRFRTCYPVTLWPIRVERARIESTDQFDFLETSNTAAVLRLRLVSEGVDFAQLDMRSLRFHLNADPVIANGLFELLFTQVDRVAFLQEGMAPVIRPVEEVLHQVGFDPEDAVLPSPEHGHPAYRLLQEYFTFPEKFHFIDVRFPPLERAGNTVDVLFLLNYLPPGRLSVEPGNFALGCTPVINLFHRLAEPIRLDHRRTEYRVVADYRRERTTEIHSILSVAGISVEDGRRTEFRPFFSFDHDHAEAKAFWAMRREPTGRKDMPGTDTYLSFLNLDSLPERPSVQTVVAETLCTNRMLAEQIPPGALLNIERAAPLKRIVCLNKPTLQRSPPMGGKTAWQLISHLSLNYLSLSEGAESLQALKEILRLYAPPGDAAAAQQIQGIRRMECRRAVRRVGEDAWRGFCRGIEVEVEFDERAYVGGSALLFSAVLDRFLGLYTTVNSFTRLIVTSFQRSGTWKAWPPRIGGQRVL